jgi:hypothetical protein
LSHCCTGYNLAVTCSQSVFVLFFPSSHSVHYNSSNTVQYCDSVEFI